MKRPATAIACALLALAARATPSESPAASAAEAGALPARLARTLAHLDAVRASAGAGPLAIAAALMQSASAHAAYLGANGFRSAPSIHAETADRPGFSGADPFVRMRAAGYQPSYATEVVGDIGLVAPDSDCVGHLMNTIYHATLLLSRVTEAGIAYGDGAASGACVIDLGRPQADPAPAGLASGAFVRYPAPGMAMPGGSFRLASENPRPSPAALPGATAGIPVLVGLRNTDFLDGSPPHAELLRFELRDTDNLPVPAVVLADQAISGPDVVADAGVHGAFAVLVPRRPLPPGRYRVFLRAILGDGHVLAPDPWSFTITGP